MLFSYKLLAKGIGGDYLKTKPNRTPLATPAAFIILQPPVYSLVRRVVSLNFRNRRRDKRRSVIKWG